MADLFESMAEIPPDRGEETEENIEPRQYASASQSEGSSPNDSDLQTLMKVMFPELPDNLDNEDIRKIAKFIMMGRVFPDNFSTKIYLLVCNLAEKHFDDPKFDPWEMETIIEGMCQIGLEGKGRVEALIGAGNTKEQSEQEQGNRAGGF